MSATDELAERWREMQAYGQQHLDEEGITLEQAFDIIAAFDKVAMDFDGSGRSWGYGGGRDLSTLADDVRCGRSPLADS